MSDDILIWGRHWYDVVLTLYLVGGFLLEALFIERESGWPHWHSLGWSFVDKKMALSIIFAYSLTLTPPPLSAVTVEGRALRLWVAFAITWELAALIHAKWRVRSLTRA